jgi:hypothetical protein
MNYRNLTDEETNVLKQWHAWGEPPLGPWAVIAYNNDVLGAFLGCGGYLSHFLPAD